MGLIYLDTCLVIYAFERHPQFGVQVLQRLSEYPAAQFAISPLVKMECLVAPFKQQNIVLQDYYQQGLARFSCLSMPEGVFLLAAQLRAEHGLKAPDALHLATAQYHGCQAFWTNDQRLCRADAMVLSIISV